ncbi:MAG: hypothetical protein M1819_001149 [Sarea resinae]|nr:MAG: hypothetical protein M1819_001149 [Sarea resinae]
MADTNGGSELSHPNLNLTPEEKRVFRQLFQQADTDNIGVVTGEVAVKFFERTKLAPSVLGEIWQIADTENRGLLTPSGFGVVLRLIGHYQAGRDPTPELAFQPPVAGPLPKFEGLNINPTVPTPGPPAPGLQAQSSGGPIRVPPLTPEKVHEYASLFEKSGAQNGVLSGETAKQIFERARLPNEVLGRIWNLSDIEQRGALGVTEFVIAMHLLASYKSGVLRALPQILPPGLYEAAARRAAPRATPQISGFGSPVQGAPPVSGIPKQLSGAAVRQSQSPMGRASYGTPPQSAQATGSDWAITAQDKAQFDSIFATVDKAGRGYILGDQAVGFFGNSKLPEETLAQIWDLADINSEGRLNRDEFAVAMYLIRQQRGRREGRGALPPTLPTNLVPPSMRQQVIPPSQPTAPTFDNSYATTQPKSASEDLFGLDAFSSPAPSQSQASTGPGSPTYNRGFDSDLFNKPAAPAAAPEPQSTQHQQPTFKPFIPSSSFGQNIMAANTTGGSSGSAPGQRGPPPAQQSSVDDLLGDNDPEVSKKLTHETTELANLSNQVGTLSKQMQEVKNKRTSTDHDLSKSSSQKREFETRLSQLRTLYEQEVKDVKALEERLSASRNETRKLQQDIAMIEGSYQDLQNQHRQVVGNLEADQKENASLKERMRQVNAEINQLKPQLDKLRSEARQQKGLVAINKKQLATNESERDKVKTDIDDVSREIQEYQSAPPVQSPGKPTSPAASTTSQSTNPFFRRSPVPASENTMSPSPFAREPAQNQNAFDNMFGPSFTPPQTSGPPPTSFRSEPHPRDVPTVSGQSVRSSEGPDLPTPSTSPQPSSQTGSPPAAPEPPPPPESRQITSNFLPFRETVQRTDSLSSSVKVSAPASRYGGNDYSGADTPTNWVSSANATPIQERSLSGGDETDTIKTETASRAPSSTFDRNTTASPAASDAPRPASKASETRDQFQGYSQPIPTRESVPGAFPADPTSPIKSTPTGESTLSDRSKASSRRSDGFQSNRSDPFSMGRAEPRVSTGTKDDFDAAFAGFGAPRQVQERQHTGGSSAEGSVGTGSVGPNRFNQEFPPIEEFSRDDESDSGSEHGFDDNFTSASPEQRHASASQGPPPAAPEPPSSDPPEAFRLRPSVTHLDSTGSQLPTPGAQKAPPSYDQTVSAPTGSHRDSNQFPQEFGGLLPSRQDPTSPPSSNSPEKSYSSPLTGGQTLFGGSPGTSQPPQLAQAPAPAKNAFDEFDDQDFADLDEAKEADERENDEFGMSSHHREGLDEFNPVFDSPGASKTSTMASQHTATGSVPHLGDSFNDFEQNIGAPPQASGQANAPEQPAATSQDWDAIFAGLDTPQGSIPGGVAGGASQPSEHNAFEPAPGQEHAAEGDNMLSPPGRPAVLGRALSAGTEHDDPILKRLTGMGYARDDALNALEQYDYNLDKVSVLTEGNQMSSR